MVHGSAGLLSLVYLTIYEIMEQTVLLGTSDKTRVALSRCSLLLIVSICCDTSYVLARSDLLFISRLGSLLAILFTTLRS